MSDAAWVFSAIVYLSLVGIVITAIIIRRPTPKKPVERDALEAADSALRLRIIDLEDKFETHVKREAVRGQRARQEENPAQGVLPLDRGARLQAVRERARAAGLVRGG